MPSAAAGAERRVETQNEWASRVQNGHHRVNKHAELVLRVNGDKLVEIKVDRRANALVNRLVLAAFKCKEQTFATVDFTKRKYNVRAAGNGLQRRKQIGLGIEVRLGAHVETLEPSNDLGEEHAPLSAPRDDLPGWCHGVRITDDI